MRTQEIARDLWDVQAVENESGQCQVLEHLLDLRAQEPELFQEVAAFLRDDLPINGPPPEAKGRSGIVPSTKRLREGISEFRLGRRPFPAYRVLWFEGNRPRQIICANAFTKRDASTPVDALPKAIRLRQRYLEDRRKDQEE